MSRARQGKIARLPHALREEINRRLGDGETGGTVLTWLNAQPEAIKIWEVHFEGAPATPQNLSEWRLGGYRDWQTQRQKVEDLKSLSAYALNLAKSGGQVADGVAAVVAGHMLESFEELIYGAAPSGKMSGEGGDDGEAAMPDLTLNISRLAQAATRLKKANLDEKKLDLSTRQAELKEKEHALSREKFETQTVAKFLEWAKKPEALAIMDSGKPAPVQMELMRALMFGME